METIISAIISAAAAISVCVINSTSQHRRLLAELDKHSDMQAYRIEQLEQKVSRHNSVIERTYRLEEQIKVANHRIADLEEK